MYHSLSTLPDVLMCITHSVHVNVYHSLCTLPDILMCITHSVHSHAHFVSVLMHDGFCSSLQFNDNNDILCEHFKRVICKRVQSAAGLGLRAGELTETCCQKALVNVQLPLALTDMHLCFCRPVVILMTVVTF